MHDEPTQDDIDPTRGDIDVMAAWLDSQEAHWEELESLPYDGLRGLPPDWVPEVEISEFRNARDNLLTISPSELYFLVLQIESIIDGGDPAVPGVAPDPIAWLRCIYKLADLRKASALSPKEGMKAIAGKDAELGWSQRRSAREGHELRYGDDAAKKARRDDAQARVDKMMNDHPRWSYNRAMDEVAKRAKAAGEPNFSKGTLKRYTVNPRK